MELPASKLAPATLPWRRGVGATADTSFRAVRRNVARSLRSRDTGLANVNFDANLPRRPLSFAVNVLPALLYAAAIFYGGLIRMGALPQVGFVATDKLLHASAFAGLALLLARASHWVWPASPLRTILFRGAFGASAAGLLLELCQAFTPYRSADPWVWVADTIGALLAVAVGFAVLKWVPRRAHG